MPTKTDWSLDAPAPQLVKYNGSLSRVAFLSDIHVPFHSDTALNLAWKVLKDFKPDLVYLGGDIHDNYTLSDWGKDPDRFNLTLQDEFDVMQRVIVKPLKALDCRVIYQLGNHEVRTYQAMRRQRALAGLRALSYKRAAELPEKWLVFQDQMHLRLGSLLFHHGNLAGRRTGGRHLAATMLDALRTSSIFGHHHRFDRAYQTDYEGHVIGAFANGHLSDPDQARYISCPNWTQGFSLVEYSRGMKEYQVYQLLVVNRSVVWNGKTYAAINNRT